MTRSGPPHGNQRGAALLITLILVALISLLAFGASQATRTQQQLATNEAASQIAFQGAEAGLRAAEREIAEADDLALFCSQGGDSRYEIVESQGLENDQHWQDLGKIGKPVAFSLFGSDDEWVSQPRYVIGCLSSSLIETYTKSDPIVKGQNIEDPDPRYFFRVFSLGFGPGERASVKLEARYVF